MSTILGAFQCGQLKNITNALGHETTFDLYDANGRVLKKTDPNGVVTEQTYDLRGRELTITKTSPGGSARVTAFTYDAAGQLITVSLPAGPTLTYDYDAAHYLRSVTDNAGNRIEYGYDLKGNRTTESTYDPGGVLKRTVTNVYDLRDRLQSINAAGSITQMVFDAVGNLQSETDPNSNLTDHDYDPLGRLTQTLDALQGVTGFQYNVADQLTSVSAPNGAVTTYSYDDLGNQLQVASPDTGTTVYGYDAAGNRTGQTDARGVTVGYSYDALNRLTVVDYPGTALDQSFSYDQGQNQKGRLTGITDASGTTSQLYDPVGNMIQDSRTIDGQVYLTNYAWDAGDRLIHITYPSGRQVDYLRDALGGVTEVTTTVGAVTETVANGFTYLPFGPISGYTHGSGLAVSRSYDQQYRISALSSTGVQNLTYTLDVAGNIDAITDNLNASYSQSFTQDVLHPIDSETGGYGTKGYSYDSVGNRLTRTWSQGPTQTLTYVPNSNRMGTQDSVTVVLDAAGNTLDDGAGRTFTYDDTNRMVSASVGGTLAATYAYHASGQRVKKVKAQGTQRKTIFHYGLGAELIGETVYASTGVKEAAREYIWLDSLPLAMVETTYDGSGQVTAEEIIYLHADHLATPRLGTDVSGTVVWRWSSDGFGPGDADTDPDGDQVETIIALRFPGQYFDEETGLHYNYYRDYDSNTGRYIESDPIGLAGGSNSYVYTLNNPLTWKDPLGQCSSCDPYDPKAGIPCVSQCSDTGDCFTCCRTRQQRCIARVIRSARCYYSGFVPCRDACSAGGISSAGPKPEWPDDAD